jgi:hypothetical protein
MAIIYLYERLVDEGQLRKPRQHSLKEVRNKQQIGLLQSTVGIFAPDTLNSVFRAGFRERTGAAGTSAVCRFSKDTNELEKLGVFCVAVFSTAAACADGKFFRWPGCLPTSSYARCD